MSWSSVRNLITFWDSSANQTWTTANGYSVTDVLASDQELILGYLKEIYDVPGAGRDFLDFMVLVNFPIRIGTANNGEELR